MTESYKWKNLHKLYEFESSKVSGPGSYRRDINDVLWTFDELTSTLKFSNHDTNDFSRLIEDMIEKKDIMKISMTDGKERYITRVAEIVRLLGHNYEYWFRGRQGIDSVRWLIEDKKIPRRDIPVEKFILELTDTITKELGDKKLNRFHPNLKTAIEMVLRGIGKYFLNNDWKKAKFSNFQLKSAKEMILSQYKNEHGNNQTQILTAGVGSGKTIAFSIAILVSAVEGLLDGEDNRRCHLFLYPRKALARDQYKKLEEIAKCIGLEQLQVHFEHHSYYQSIGLSVKDGISRTYNEISPPPDVIITTLETLNRRLQNPLVICKLAKYLARVVLDEIHLIEGISGCNIIRLMDRLRVACEPKKILWTGSSATVANPDFHVKTVFGLENTNNVIIIEPERENLKTVGLVHHVFLRPSGTLSFLGTLVNSTSTLVHNRRDRVYDRSRKDYPKTIGFTNSLDLLGRWNSDFRENERTENSSQRYHPKEEDPHHWTGKQREIPYALRFHHPLDRRINALGGSSDSEPYQPVLEEFRNQNLCEKCKNNERITLKTCNREELSQLGKFVHRWPTDPKKNGKTLYINNKDIFEANYAEVGTLDLCPYLRAGACFWFSKDDFEIEQILEGNYPRYEWKSVARSKIHSSKTKSKLELDEDLSDLVFRGTVKEVYDLTSDKDLDIDVVLASPSLEVGVDLPNVEESIMFKAIRNVASYRQKVGRIGREEETDTININLLSLRPIDLHYYRQPKKLTSIAHLDPIPLKEHNESILRSSLYMSVWDFLALNSNLPEVIPKNLSEGETEFTKRLRRSLEYLDKNKDIAANYLSEISRKVYTPESFIVQDAIKQVIIELKILISPTHGTIEGNVVSSIADIIVNSLTKYGKRITPPTRSRNLVRLMRGNKEYKEYRPDINPILFNLSKEFIELDRYSECGWVKIEELKEIRNKINSAIDKENPLVDETDKESLELLSTRGLNDIISGLEGMIQSGENPIVVSFWQQFEKFKEEHVSGKYYLSYTLQDMPIFNAFKINPAYTRPPNLFSNPYEERVAISKNNEIEDSIQISEALFGFVPGTWTFRLGKNPKKVKVGHLTTSRGGVLTATLNQMQAAGNRFYKIKTNVPPPPGSPATNLAIYCPNRLSIQENKGKHVLLNEWMGTIMDKDEDHPIAGRQTVEDENDEDSSYNRMLIKIPVSYLNRWVHIVSNKSEKILVNKLDEENLVIEEKDPIKGQYARNKILHPIMKNHLDSVNWHSNLEICDYIHSISRAYSSRSLNNVTLMFRDQEGDAAIGRYFVTEGISIDLNTEMVEQTVLGIQKGIINCSNKWAPSVIKAYMALLSQLRLKDGTSVSPFKIEDLIGTLITSITSEFDCKRIYDLPNILRELVEDGKFKIEAQNYFTGKYFIDQNIEETWTSELTKQDQLDIERNVNQLFDFATQIIEIIPDLDKFIKQWIIQTLLNSFGLSALSAMQRLVGSNDQEIGYSIDLEGMNKGKYRIFLYDNTHYGNGSSEVLRKYLHILNIQRHCQSDASRLLPTEDFLTILEQELLQCPQFHTDMDAIQKHSHNNDNNLKQSIPELSYIGEYSDEVLRVCRDTWLHLGIKTTEDAWKLPIISLAPASFANKLQIEVDDVIRASTICWNGCPECVIHSGMMMGSVGKSFVDKAILDEWFRRGREKVIEYKNLPISELASDKKIMEIGRQSKVVLQLHNRKIRSVSLPFTIGFEIQREEFPIVPKLIIRDNDVENLKLFENGTGRSAHGIEALGFRRIMWYNLITSAYLDILNLLDNSRKEIILVYYDCRDLSFEDIGLSNRMIEAIEYQKKKEGIKGEIRNLSDILEWLAKRKFKIQVCVDEKKSRDKKVGEFLKKLLRIENAEIKINVKKLYGLMHKKALITPIGIIQGSSNLTFSGTALNEEIVNFAPFGAQEYEEMKINIMDTFYGSKEWKGNQ